MYKIVERDIGRAGRKEAMLQKQEEWNKKYGEGKWITGYEVDGLFMTREIAINQVYAKAYFDFLDNNPRYVKELENAAGVFNPHSHFSNSVDIQAQIVVAYMHYKGLSFNGSKMIAIGSWQPKSRKEAVFQEMQLLGYQIQNDKIKYPPISYALSPFNIKCLHDNNLSIEGFWQSSSKCLAIIEDTFTTLIGDIFELAQTDEVICVTTNGIIKKGDLAVMGAGIARLFRDHFKGIDSKLASFLKNYGNRCFNMGRFDYKGKSLIVATFPTKQDYNDNSNLDLIEKSANEILEMANKFNWSKIYLPFPGGGKGNLRWNEVSLRLRKLDSRFIIISTNPNDFK